MKFHSTSLETVQILEINESNFALYMETGSGKIAIVMPEKKMPEIYPSMEAAQAAVSQIISVSYVRGGGFAKATIA